MLDFGGVSVGGQLFLSVPYMAFWAGKFSVEPRFLESNQYGWWFLFVDFFRFFFVFSNPEKNNFDALRE